MRLKEYIEIQKRREFAKAECKGCPNYIITGKPPYSGFDEPQHIECTLNPELSYLCAGDEHELNASCPLKDNSQLDEDKTKLADIVTNKGNSFKIDSELCNDTFKVLDYVIAKALDDSVVIPEDVKKAHDYIVMTNKDGWSYKGSPHGRF